MQLSDSTIREHALDPELSFIIEAPAGSGKTELLVRRYLTLLASVDKPETILAITFTRKAASEMKERIMQALPHDARSQSFIEDRLRIMTIDAFCKEITATVPLQANLFGAEMLEDEAELAAEFLEALLQVIEEKEEGFKDFIALFQYFDNQLMETATLLLKLLKNREEWLALVLQARSAGALSLLLQRSIEALYAEVAAELRVSLEEVQRLKQLIPHLFTQKFELRKRVDASLKTVMAQLTADEHLRDLYLRIAHLPDFNFEAQAILPIMLRILPLAAAHLRVVLESRNETDFHEIALTALTLLEDDEKDVLRRMDAQIQHILIDEFQDTSKLQFQLLKLLTQDWTTGDGRTLFLVGDPKQSIYRFRGAEVGLFLEAKNRGIGHLKLEFLELTENFRTDAPLLHWINQTCLNFFPAVEDERLGKVKYKPSLPHPRDYQDRGPPMHFELCQDDAAEAEWITTKILALQNSEPAPKIAILVRARGHYAPLISRLEARGLSYSVAADKRWLDSVFLDDLISLLYALGQPQDRLSWFALLRSPFCGWSMQQIYDFVASGQALWEALPSLSALVTGEDALLTLHHKFTKAAKLLVEPRVNTHEAEILQRFLRFLLQLDILPEQQVFRSALARFDFGEDVIDAPITFLTIHQAKGLEFDQVFLPALHKRVAGNDPPLLYTETFYHEAAFYFLLAERKTRGGDASSLYQYIEWLEKQKNSYETMRLFYVAITRAKHGLFLSAVQEQRHLEKDVKVPKGSFLSLLQSEGA